MPFMVAKRSTMDSNGQPLNCQSVPSVTTATTRNHWAFVKLFTLSRTSKVHILPDMLRTISTYSGRVLSKKRMRSSSFLVYSPSCRSFPAFRMFTGEFLLQGTRMIGRQSRSDAMSCSSSLRSGVLPASACRSLTGRSGRFGQHASSCAIFRMRSALGIIRPGHLTRISSSFTGLTRAATSACRISPPALASMPGDLAVVPASLLPAPLPCSPSSRGRFRPSMTSLTIPAHACVLPTNQSQRSPRLATPRYLKPLLLVVSCVYGLSPVISRNMYHTDPMSIKSSVWVSL
mmetsp:Transcript_433/g.1209  ORF Transcript_433/g.1209 Transcript_433/m.1209 type:complete len:289 (+) Transcript_433:169-1035(+)